MKPHTLLNTDERAVSPVIGVILMVAITVILAAVIGTFVLGLGGNIGDSVTAGVTVEDEGTSAVTVTLANKGTADEVRISDQDDSSTNETLSTVGSSVTVGTGSGTELSSDGNYSVVAVAGDEESLIRTFEAT